ncbi:MAG: aspartate/glutamate racemase family protein [Gammaproteobacteria bacterium]
MKTIGLLGGMSWESTASYYRAINEGIKGALGGLHSARIVLYSVDFDPVEKMQQAGDWDSAAELLADAGKSVQTAGADCLLICANTMHKIAPQVERAVGIPLLHIADATGEALVRAGIRKAGLLGTAFTMEQDFYRGRLADRHGLEVVTPNAEDRRIVHRIIYEELCLGTIEAASKQAYLRVIDDLVRQGAEAVILGCTEIALLVSQNDTSARLFDTAALHAQKAVEFALKGHD